MSNAESHTIKTGESLTLTFQGYASAGYLWSVAHKDEGLHIDHLGTIAPKTDAIGAFGQDVFSVKADKAGEYDVHFALARPWEKGTEPAQTKHFRITVK